MADQDAPDFVERFLDELTVLVVVRNDHVSCVPMGIPMHWHQRGSIIGVGPTTQDALKSLRRQLLQLHDAGIIDIKVRKLKLD